MSDRGYGGRGDTCALPFHAPRSRIAPAEGAGRGRALLPNTSRPRTGTPHAATRASEPRQCKACDTSVLNPVEASWCSSPLLHTALHRPRWTVDIPVASPALPSLPLAPPRKNSLTGEGVARGPQTLEQCRIRPTVPGAVKAAHRPGAGGRFAASEGVETQLCAAWAVQCVLRRAHEGHFSRCRQECTAELAEPEDPETPLPALCRALEQVRAT